MHKLFLLFFFPAFSHFLIAAPDPVPVWEEVQNFSNYAVSTRNTGVISSALEAECVWNMLKDETDFKLVFDLGLYHKSNNSPREDTDAPTGLLLLKKRINGFADQGKTRQPDLYASLSQTKFFILPSDLYAQSCLSDDFSQFKEDSLMTTRSSAFTPKALIDAVRNDFEKFLGLDDANALIPARKESYSEKIMSVQYLVFHHIYQNCSVVSKEVGGCTIS